MTRLARMHTAEHILSAVMKVHFGASRNLELHLNEKKTKCDYAPAHLLSEADIVFVEELVNAEIEKDHPVRAELVSREEAEAAGCDLWKVPPDAATIRIVYIGDFDATPCSGEHVQRTSEIGRFQILSHEWRDNGRLRIRFKVVD